MSWAAQSAPTPTSSTTNATTQAQTTVFTADPPWIGLLAMIPHPRALFVAGHGAGDGPEPRGQRFWNAERQQAGDHRAVTGPVAAGEIEEIARRERSFVRSAVRVGVSRRPADPVPQRAADLADQIGRRLVQLLLQDRDVVGRPRQPAAMDRAGGAPRVIAPSHEPTGDEREVVPRGDPQIQVAVARQAEAAIRR